MAQMRAPTAPSSSVPSQADLNPAPDPAEALLEHPVARALLDSVPGYALILTGDRQLLAGRGEVLEELGLTTPESLQGLRAGELFRCTPVRDGFSRARQFWVSSVPLRVGGVEALLFIFKETTEQKRREALEQVFLHDLLNLVGELDGIAGRLRERPADADACCGQIQELAHQLVDEIQSQRILLGADDGSAEAQRRLIRPGEILDRLARFFANSQAAEGRRLEIQAGAQEAFTCDPVLLTRVLVNMVKNALEATPRGGIVKVWHERQEDRRGFVVENPGVIPSEVAVRVFERCFSTKACQGRGLGAFGAKLLGEQLLGGEVGFAPHGGTNTRFFIWIPETGACPVEDPARSAFSCGPPPDEAPEGADTLLVVDDSRTLCRLLGNLLCPRYRVLTAENGEDGFTLAVKCRPDLILLDVMMPDMDGLAVCRRLKQRFPHPGDSRAVPHGPGRRGRRDARAGSRRDRFHPQAHQPAGAGRPGAQPAGAEAPPGPAAQPFAAGRAHRHRQPAPVRPVPGHGVAALQPQRPAAVPGHGRRGFLQGLQRRLWPRPGRRVPARGGPGVRPWPCAGRRTWRPVTAARSSSACCRKPTRTARASWRTRSWSRWPIWPCPTPIPPSPGT